ncbi:MAG: right-handed parallel beta-helix repeat-containing protein [Akkermansiaceae bacterium]|nr:right-handed parallel beta-helix repeat-containing protein [Akkermansiaceae bacterium]
MKPTLIIAVSFFTAPFLAAQTIINVNDHGALPNDGGAKGAARAGDDTAAFKQAIAAAKAAAGPVTLFVPPGVYDFYPDDATQRACFTSNSTETGSHGMKTLAIDVVDVDDLTISAVGATFMMRGKMTMFVAEQCENLTLRGMTFDTRRPTMSELTVTEKGGDYWIGKVHPDSDYSIIGSRVQWLGEGWADYHNMVQHYDPVQKTTWRGGDPTSGVSSIQDLGGNRLKFNVTGGGLGNAVVGRTYQFRNTTRDQIGMWFNHCKDVLMQDVTVRAMHGFGILGQFTENITYERLTVAPDPASGRTNASAADVTHFSGCKGLVRIVDSVLSAAHDDALNVHGTHLRVVAKPAASQVRVKFMHHQTYGFQAFFPGDDIKFISRTTLLPIGSAKVTAVVVENETEQLLTLDQAVPAAVSVGSDAVENVTWTPSFQLINCDIKQIPTRGILVTTRRPVLIQGNRFFRTQMAAILIEDDANGWFESGRVLDFTAKGNVFYECGGGGVVTVNPENSSHGGAVHQNFLFEGNEFVMNSNKAFSFKSSSDIMIRNNKFRMRNGSSPTAQSLTSQSHVTNITFDGNISVSSASPSLKPVNGAFELPGIGAGAQTPGLASWSGTGGELLLGSGFTEDDNAVGYTASQTALIPAGGAIFQKLGYYDPVDQTVLNWSLRQTTRSSGIVGSGGAEISFYQGDGRFPETGTLDSLARVGNVVSLSALGSGRLSRLARGSLVMDGLEAGAEIWVAIKAAAQDVTVDDFLGVVANFSQQVGLAQWLIDENVPPGETAYDSDSDGDRMPLLIEYAVGGRDPMTAEFSQLAWAAPAEGGGEAFHFMPSVRPDVTLMAEYQIGGLASDGWLPLDETTPGFSWIEGDVMAVVPDEIDERIFFRLRAEMVSVLTVTNGSFESPDRTGADPAYSTEAPVGWVFTASVNGGVEEIRDDRFGVSGSEGTRLDALGGRGDQLGYLNLGSGGSSSASAVSAAVTTVLPETTYRVTVAYGTRVSGDRSPDGTLGLMVGSTELSSPTVIDASSLAAGFTDISFDWTSPAVGDPLIGQDLRVMLRFSYASDLGGWQQAQIDNVRVEILPENPQVR